MFTKSRKILKWITRRLGWKQRSLLKQEGHYFNLQNKRKEHDLVSLIFKVRNTLLDIGFTEAIVPVIIEKGEVYQQYGPEAPVILDRIFFLAGLDRP